MPQAGLCPEVAGIFVPVALDPLFAGALLGQLLGGGDQQLSRLVG
jgi:hypothetical protein